ncbi:MAG: ThiF family adenylyltransferase, partial [Bacteroidaceae bacterium]|nr:ThiF family adenylyltransferase [Bacteroidaceae bacterium]
SVLFREEDAFTHAYKAEVVARRAREINPQIEVTPIVGNLASEVGLGLYRSVDVVIGCLDSLIARYLLNRMCMRADKTWIDGGIENLTGMARVFTPGVSCFECSLTREEFNHIMIRTGCADVVRLQAEAGRMATTPISASIIAAIQVQEALKVIHRDTDAAKQFRTLEGRWLNYEGMTNSMKVFRNQAWKNTCPSHEQWAGIVRCTPLSATTTVRDALQMIAERLQAKDMEINMRNNKFVDWIMADKTEEKFEVMLPESKLQAYINDTIQLRQLSRITHFFQNFYDNINADFPYKNLTLQQIGIPPYDIIQVTTNQGSHYVELSADAPLFT